jgi:hypothetical protein
MFKHPANRSGIVAVSREDFFVQNWNGGRGIRTPGAVNPAVFKTAAIVHSAIPPFLLYHR